ncbi:MAG: hypothetical protein AAF353_08675, partial [Pseudomonadota bacterium]
QGLSERLFLALLLLLLAGDLKPGAQVDESTLSDILETTVWICGGILGLIFLLTPLVAKILKTSNFQRSTTETQDTARQK